MGARLTNRWTNTLGEAFGATGDKGLEGELWMMEVFRSWGWECTHHPDDRKLQVAGIDITFRNPEWYNSYTCDIKNNQNEYGTFYVHSNWLMKRTYLPDRVFHINPDTGWIAWYPTKDMRKWCNRHPELVRYTKNDSKYWTIKANMKLKFVTRKHSDVGSNTTQPVPENIDWNTYLDDEIPY